MCRNVLLVTIDSLRTDHLTQFGHSRAHDDCLSSLADRHTSFRRAFATGPGTTPSFPALLLGTLPLSYEGMGPLHRERPRVSRRLGRNGFSTAAFHCNPFLSAHFNYDLGFETFKDYQNPLMGLATRLFPRGIEIGNPRLRSLDDALHVTDIIKRTYRLVRGKPRPYVQAEVITDDAIDWLQTVDDPFFCWTHYMDVHHPCHPPSPYRESFDVGAVSQREVTEWYSAMLRDPGSLDAGQVEWLRRLYDAAIAYVDDEIYRLLGALDRTGRLRNTLVVVTSDHGELFGEHGQYGKPERMYDELLHVPLVVVNGPDYLDDATGELVSLLDVPPLLHEVLDLNVPEAYAGRIPGVDEPRDLIMAEHEIDGEVVVGARSDEWLYEHDETADRTCLFHVDGELERVPPDKYTAESAEVRRAVHERLIELDVASDETEEGVPTDVESRLEDLGYL